MNFGHKVAIGYTVFVGFIVVLVVFSFKQNYQLEEENYYEKELLFEDEIKAEKNYLSLGQEIIINANNGLQLLIPDTLLKEKVNFNIELKRPSQSQYDRNFTINANSSKNIRLPAENLISGLYQIKVSFVYGGQNCCFKSPVYLSLNSKI